MKRLISIFIAAFVVLVGAAYIVPAHQASAASSASLSIVPKKNYTIEPGKSVNDKLTIRNLDPAQPLELNLRVIDFTYTDNGGTPKLMLATDAPETTWSLKPFLTVPESVTIPPNSSKTVDMSVKIPANHGAGSYYSAILYSSGAPGDGGNVGLSASGATLVFTSIPGQVNEDLKIKNFGAYDTAAQGKDSGYLFITGNEPQNLAYTLQNNGNVTEAPVGSIVLKDIFGKEQTINNVNPSGSLALIGQTRTFTTCIKIQAQDVNFNGSNTQTNTCASPGLWPGVYTATLDVFYGQNGNKTQEIVKTATFWYLPMWFIFLFIVVLIILAYVVLRTVRAIRRKIYGPQLKKSSRRK
ncbi:MAG: hypothetical protein ABIQ04_04095 [Candidatus Saccharimonadales bacterium]